MADVKAEVNRSMELDELRKMKESVEAAARDVQTSVQSTTAALEKDFSSVSNELKSLEQQHSSTSDEDPCYQHPAKNVRLQRSAVPRWYKSRQGVRTHVQSGAARVARFRPKKR